MIIRHFKIKVNGKAYDVEVEDIDGTSAAASPAPTAPGRAAPATMPGAFSSKPAASAAAKPAAAPAPSQGGPGWVACPMAGKVQKIPVTVGQSVTAETVVAVLEAMKMETSVCAGQKGTVSEIAAAEGAVVDSGALLVKIS